MSGGLYRALLRGPLPGLEGAAWAAFEDPVEQLEARRLDEVAPVLSRVEAATREGLWAVGAVAYEAAPAFDGALAGHAGSAPLASFALFRPPRRASLDPSAAGAAVVLAPALGAGEHASAVGAIRAAIADGAVYQVNFTFPIRAELEGDGEALFARLATASHAPFAALLEFDDAAIVSLSPELFFELDGERIAMRPMKGTRPRGRFGEEDEALAAELAGSDKDRAENLMIVDMARNDLGRIARTGSVAVTSLFDLERYPTVWQMTSTVGAETVASLPSIFGALFPCASVTGAPKPAATAFIAELEREPRGIYCGAIGWMAPTAARRARFSVAIRTATVDRATGSLTYGVGSGVVWDSDAGAEYDECLAKARVLADPGEPIALFETMRLSPRGVRFLESHLARLAASAAYFDLPFDPPAARAAVEAECRRLRDGQGSAAFRLRLRLGPGGELVASGEPFEGGRPTWRAVVAAEPVDSRSPLLFHKTTRRALYDAALAEARSHGGDEAILWNERGELTEGSRTNLILRIDGRWLTPARECGLLAGVLRGRLLERGRIREAVLRKEQLLTAERVLFVSALRGAIPFELA